MPLTLKDPSPAIVRIVYAWRVLRVHLDAMCHSPRDYLMATWWHLSGKRLRARAQMAPLLGLSLQSYNLWLLKEDRVRNLATPIDTATSIVALVDGGNTDAIALDHTLRSLASERIAAILVGTPDVPDLPNAIRHIDWGGDVWLMPLKAGDVLAQGAAAAYRAASADQKCARIIYADDDILDARGRRTTPHFKPAWNGELFRYFDYLTGTCIVRTGAQDLKEASGRDWASRLVSAVTTSIRENREMAPLRIPAILHHRRSRTQPSIPAPLKAAQGDLPLVSVIVPTRNRLDLLRPCLEGLARTDYPAMEVIVVDNGSDDRATLDYLADLERPQYRILRHFGPFNFAMLNNRAAEEARGSLLCLLNNDIEIMEPGWLRVMATQALREDVGAVGARLLYPNGRIQHAGVVLGIGGAAAHAHRLLHPDEVGYFRRHALPQFVSAVTAACLVVQRDRFAAVGGMDEVNFPVAFNDVDLCLRLNAVGWNSLYEPRATLVHHESVSRGFDRDPVGAARLGSEVAALKDRWKTERTDPFHHPHLSPFSERFTIGL